MWPVYLVTLHLAVLWIIFTLHVGHTPSPDVGKLTAISYVRQILLVQLWFEPFFDGTSWDGPAWSISAEWLAYLLFGALVMVIFRMKPADAGADPDGAGLRRAAAADGAAAGERLLLHAVELAAAHRHPVHRGCAGLRRRAQVASSPTAPARSSGTSRCSLSPPWWAVLYLLDAYPIHGVLDSGGVVDVLFVPLVITLAVGVGSLPRLLSTRVLVYGGQISFCLYMVHELVHTSLELGRGAVRAHAVALRLAMEVEHLRPARDRPGCVQPDVSLRRGARPSLDAQDGRHPAGQRQC